MKKKHILFTFLLTTISFAVSMEEPFSQNLLFQTYGTDDLATKPAFQGGYINFGYWENIWPKQGEITLEERIKASEALYDLIIDKLEINAQDKILEVGAGRGNGCVKIVEEIKPRLVTGVDITPQQTQRSKDIHQNVIQKYHPCLEFITASSSSLPFSDNSYSKIYSVEAAQCFPSIDKFAKEAWRVLQSRGKLVITAHFATDQRGYEELKKLIPTVEQGVDRLIPIQSVRLAFKQAGFKEIHFEDIGEHVFEGQHQWISQVEDVPWGKNLLETYKKSYMSYYVIALEKL